MSATFWYVTDGAKRWAVIAALLGRSDVDFRKVTVDFRKVDDRRLVLLSTLAKKLLPNGRAQEAVC
eukprot:SAG31_NODE_132_length_23398_cov_14.557620_13_plen_66_part_00